MEDKPQCYQELPLLLMLLELATHSFLQCQVTRSMFKVDERMIKKVVVGHALVWVSLQKASQQRSTVGRNVYVVWNLCKHTYHSNNNYYKRCRETKPTQK